MLEKDLAQHFETILVDYTRNANQKHLLSAKDYYFSRIGTVHDEDDDYEARINAFYDWYIFQFQSPYIKKTVIQEYIEKHELSEELVKAFLTVNFSLFEYNKINFRKNIVLEDILHDEKVVIPREYWSVGLVEKDLFVGHVIHYKDQYFMLPGVAAIPREVKEVLSKEAKKIRKSSHLEDEKEFLLQIQYFKNKMKRYSHVPASEIFQFDR